MVSKPVKSKPEAGSTKSFSLSSWRIRHRHSRQPEPRVESQPGSETSRSHWISERRERIQEETRQVGSETKVRGTHQSGAIHSPDTFQKGIPVTFRKSMRSR